jgi:hypothetical protein
MYVSQYVEIGAVQLLDLHQVGLGKNLARGCGGGLFDLVQR